MVIMTTLSSATEDRSSLHIARCWGVTRGRDPISKSRKQLYKPTMIDRFLELGRRRCGCARCSRWSRVPCCLHAGPTAEVALNQHLRAQRNQLVRANRKYTHTITSCFEQPKDLGRGCRSSNTTPTTVSTVRKPLARKMVRRSPVGLDQGR